MDFTFKNNYKFDKLKKLKEFIKRLKSERILSMAIERNMIEEIKRLKHEIKEEGRLRKMKEEKYTQIIANLQTKLAVRFFRVLLNFCEFNKFQSRNLDSFCLALS